MSKKGLSRRKKRPKRTSGKCDVEIEVEKIIEFRKKLKVIPTKQ
jgi:hypothetical protein